MIVSPCTSLKRCAKLFIEEYVEGLQNIKGFLLNVIIRLVLINVSSNTS